MIVGVGQYNPVYARCDRPLPSASAPTVDQTDSVEPFSPPENPSGQSLARSALESCAGACKGFLFGPVAHYAGKLVAAVGKTPAPRKPKIPPSALGPLPSAKIEQPIVLVAGWHTYPERFVALGDKLTENGSNGGAVAYVKQGEVYSDPHCTQKMAQPPKDLKVFVSLLESNRTAPDDAQPEFDQNMSTIQRLTNGATMDITAFSMGGLELRLWVDRHKDANIGKILLLATPNQGAGLAGLSHHLLEGKKRGWDTDWLLRIKDVTEQDEKSLQWLRPHSELREDLNSRWAVQKSRVQEVLCLGSASKITLGKHGSLSKGDGMVPFSSLRLDDSTPVEVIEDDCTHGELIQSPKVYQRMLSYFGWA